MRAAWRKRSGPERHDPVVSPSGSHFDSRMHPKILCYSIRTENAYTCWLSKDLRPPITTSIFNARNVPGIYYYYWIGVYYLTDVRLAEEQ